MTITLNTDRWHITTLRISRVGEKQDWSGDEIEDAAAVFNGVRGETDVLIVELEEMLPLKPGFTFHEKIVRRQAVRNAIDGLMYEITDEELYCKTRGGDARAKLSEFGA